MINLSRKTAVTMMAGMVAFSGAASAGVTGESEGGEIPIAALERDSPVDFAKEIFPMLKANCIACHNASKAKGKLNLESPQAILKGGSEGPAVVPGNAADSLMLILAAHQDDPVMPPDDNKSNAVPLTPEELALLKLWIDQGAKGEAAAFVEAPEVWYPVKGAQQPIYNLAVARDGSIAAAGRGNQIHLYDLARGLLESSLEDPELGKEKNFETAAAAHRDLVQSLAIAPDGRVASGGFREVKIWARPAQSLIDNLPAMPESVTALAASGDGNWLIAGDAAGNVRTWRRDDPGTKREAKVHDGAVTGVAFTGDNTRTVTVSADGTIRLRAVSEDPAEIKVMAPSPVNGLALVKEGTTLATGHSDHTVRLWAIPEADSSAPLQELGGHSQPVRCVSAVAGNGALVVTGADDNTARLWNIDEKKELRAFDHGVPVTALAVSPDGKRLITAGGAAANVWNLEDGTKLTEIKGDGRTQEARRAAELALNIGRKALDERKKRLEEAAKRFKEEGDKSKAAAVDLAKAQADLSRKRVARAAADVVHGAAQVSGTDDEKKQAKEAFDKADGEVSGAEEAVGRARQNAELGVRLTARAAEENIQAESDFSVAENAVTEGEATLELANKAVADAEKPWRSVAFSGDGTMIFAGGSGQEVSKWSLDGKFLGACAGNRAEITGLLALPEDGVLAAGANKTLLHWDAAPDWKVERSLGDGKDHKPFIDRVTALAFDPTGRLLATGGGSPSRSGELKVWNVADGSLLFVNDEAHSDTIVGIEFSPDGRHIACASTDRFVRVFDAADGRELAAFEGHTSHVLDVAWRADGLVLASAGADKVIKLWDFEGRKQIKTEQGFNKEVTAVDFIGAGDAFLASSGDASVRINQEQLGGPAAYTHRAKADAAGRLIVAGDQESNLRVWQAGDKKLLFTFTPAR